MLTGPIENEGTEDVLINFVTVPGQKLNVLRKVPILLKQYLWGTLVKGK